MDLASLLPAPPPDPSRSQVEKGEVPPASEPTTTIVQDRDIYDKPWLEVAAAADFRQDPQASEVFPEDIVIV